MIPNLSEAKVNFCDGSGLLTRINEKYSSLSSLKKFQMNQSICLFDKRVLVK